MRIDKNDLLAYITRCRRELHQIPEIGLAEFKTQAYILQQLQTLSLDFIQTANTGIIAKFFAPGEKKGTIAFRADMDALSIEEQTQNAFPSLHPGAMHACGHDGHMSVLLGFAWCLAQCKQVLQYDVVLIFQPAEESTGGARDMIAAGALDGVDEVYGLHVMPSLPQGAVGIKEGALMAQACEFDIELFGVSAHGAMPHLGKDALMAAVQTITHLQTVLTRTVDPTQPALLTIGKISAGDRRNIVADYAKLEGILRTYDAEIYRHIYEQITQYVASLQKTMGVMGTVTEVALYPVVNNNAYATGRVRKAAPNGTCMVEPLMIAEDFSFYQMEKPGAFFFLGTRNEQRGFVHPLHSAQFDFDEAVLLQAITLYANLLNLGDIFQPE